jgi:hypothetical protein
MDSLATPEAARVKLEDRAAFSVGKWRNESTDLAEGIARSARRQKREALGICEIFGSATGVKAN